MNYYTESFDQFASRLTGTDLALYAGAGLILWILFKDKLSPVQELVGSFIEKFKKTNPANIVSVSSISTDTKLTKEDVFFQLITSWKQTRDLAVACGCVEAVKAADQMFPYLSPVVCSKQEGKTV